MSKLPPFSDQPEIAPGTVKTLHIAPGDQALSKDQKRFNTLLQQIDAVRKLRADWESVMDSVREIYVHQLAPLQEKIQGMRARVLVLLDEGCENQKLTRTERRKLTQLIIDRCTDLLAHDDTDSTAKRLYNKYTNSDYDEEIEEFEKSLATLIDDLLADPADAAVKDGKFAGSDDFDPFDPANHDENGHIRDSADPVKPRKKTAKQLEREARQEEERKQLSQSLKDIYRKLASSLHPDREPDAAERTRKTALMQQANEAYEQRNLLQLLELQLQVDHIDAAHLASLSEQRLKRYNVLLKEQVQAMNTALDEFVFEFLDSCGMDEVSRKDPQQALRLLRHDLAGARREHADLTHIIATLEHPAGLKSALKYMPARRPDPRF